jgi:hypothetical protein
MALAATGGAFVLISTLLAIVWSLPVSVDNSSVETKQPPRGPETVATHQIGPLSEYQMINERPVFNESRLPVVADITDADLISDLSIEASDAPDVKLTGVIITPSVKIASLSLAKGDQRSIWAHEGEPMTGEFVGWQVRTVSPRKVILESLGGETLELELVVHDVKIKEPPKPPAEEKTEKAVAAAGGEVVDEDGQPLSRAEQIRQRIAERREELRREQEEQQYESRNRENSQSSTSPSSNRTSQSSDYQNAIRSMMKNKSKEKDNSEKEDG